jgi:Rrf2 family protein
MFFSKSFGYAVRSILYIAAEQDKKGFVQLDDISTTLKLPRQFLARWLKNLVKENILISVKGPKGGFALSKEGRQVKLITILEITDGNRLDECVLKSKNCSTSSPCPLHDQFAPMRKAISDILNTATIHSLMKGEHKRFIKTLSEDS